MARMNDGCMETKYLYYSNNGLLYDDILYIICIINSPLKYIKKTLVNSNCCCLEKEGNWSVASDGKTRRVFVLRKCSHIL